MLSAVTSSNAQAVASPPKAPDAAQVFKQLDTNNKGYLNASDLASALVTISPQGAQLSADDAQAKAEADLARMDMDSDGQVTLDEFKAAEPPAPPAGSQAQTGAGTAGSAPPPSGGGAPAAGASSSQSYEPEDTNQDGTVTEQERQAYAAKHPSGKHEGSGATTAAESPTASRSATQAVDAYETIANAA